MGRFITDEVRLTRFIEKSGKPSDIFEITLDNQVYEHEDGTLEYAPRLQVRDGYSRPFGNRNKFSPEPADFHDIRCFYKERIVITLTLKELMERGYIYKHCSSWLKDKYGEMARITVCADIPKEFLKVERVEKWATDCTFKKMMCAVGVNPFWHCAYRAGVFFNIGWLWNGKRTLENYLNGTRELYKDNYGREEAYK